MTIKAIKEQYKNYQVRGGEHNSFVVFTFAGIGRCVIVVNISKHRSVGDYVMQVVRVSDGLALLEDGACRPCDNLSDAIDVASEMLPWGYVVQAINPDNGLILAEYDAASLCDAEAKRMEWTWFWLNLREGDQMPIIYAVNDRNQRYIIRQERAGGYSGKSTDF